MGRRGKTAAQKKLGGNAGRRKPKNESKILSPSVRMPRTLNEKERTYWTKYAPELRKIGSLNMLSIPIFIEWCRNMVKLDELHKLYGSLKNKYEETEYLGNDGKKLTKKSEHIYFKMMRQLSADVLKIARALKMSPDRMPAFQPQEEPSEEEKFLEG